MKGEFPVCGSCQRMQEARKNAGKRVLKIPSMFPDVALYGQEHPDAQRISEFQIEDLFGGRNIDLLLVVATGDRKSVV